MTPVWDLDATAEDADWIKGGTWDLPPYKSDDFNMVFGPDRLPWFRTTVCYKAAVARGQIVDDEWVADYVVNSNKEEKQK